METIISRFLRSFDSIIRNGDYVISEGKIYEVDTALKDYCRCKIGVEIKNINYDLLRKLNWVKYFFKSVF